MAGTAVTVTSQGGFVYETKFVSSSTFATVTSIFVVTKAVETSAPIISILTQTVVVNPVPSDPPIRTTKTENPTSKAESPTSKTESSTSTSEAPTSISPEGTSKSPTVATSAAAQTTSAGEKDSNGPPVAAIVGGALGGALLLALLAAALLYRKHRQAQETRNRDSLPSYRAVATDPSLGSPGTQYSTAGGLGLAKVANPSELAMPEMRESELRTEYGSGDVNVTHAERYELGSGANMTSVPRFEMPGHGDWEHDR